jgi:hypothetical protein
MQHFFITLFAVLCILGFAASAGAGKPEIRKKGTVECDLVEATPIVFEGTRYRFEYVRKKYAHNPIGDACFRFVDLESGEAGKAFAPGYCLGSAYTENGVMYVYGVKPWGADSIEVFHSEDLETWESRTALRLPGWTIYNNSVCRDDRGHVMAIEIGAPDEVVGQRFTIFFARSENLLNWTLAPVECCYTKEKYSACPALRHFGGWYYMVYLERLEQWSFAPYMMRSRDLVSWEASPHNPMFKPGPEDKAIANPELSESERKYIADAENINNSDVDFCEWKGKTLIYYSWGNQRGTEFLAEAVFDGTEAAFLRAWFPDTAPAAN